MKILKIICALCACALVSCGRSRDIINNDINNDNNTNVDKDPDNGDDSDVDKEPDQGGDADNPSKEDQSLKNLEFEVISEYEKTCFVKSCKQYYGDKRDSIIVIPGTYNGYKVTRVGDGAFGSCYFIKEIIISDGVKEIGNRAFIDCTSLNSISIPDSVVAIYAIAFSNCSSLTSITIPKNVNSLDGTIFDGCSSLIDIKVDGNNHYYDSRENCNAIIETASNTLIAGCVATVIPTSVNTIGTNAFVNCPPLTSITIPNNITTIQDSAFSYCTSLRTIAISSGVKQIDACAFFNCPSLEYIRVEEGNEVYDSRDNCNAIIETSTNSLLLGCQSTTIPNGITSIGAHAFQNCTSLTSISIPNSVTSIGDFAFDNCLNLTSISFPDSVNLIGKYAFNCCRNLTKIVIPKSINKIYSSTFCKCDALLEVSVENGNEVYDSRDNCNAIIETSTNLLLFGCRTTTIPNSVTSIGAYAFQFCTFLTSVSIPNSVSMIGEYAFMYCTFLNDISFDGTIDQWNSVEKYEYIFLYVPATVIHCVDGDVAIEN